jgi:2'-5' RNA ligase
MQAARMQQPGLGFDTPSHASPHNLFFALWPGDEVRAQVEAQAQALEQRFRPGGRRLKPARYHLTLQFLGEHAQLPPQLVDAVAKAAARVRTEGFDLVLDKAGSFNSVWWLGCSETPPGLQALWDALGSGLMHARIKVQSPGRFTPHLTILRGATLRLPPTSVAPVHWPVREWVLIDSQPPRPYKILHRWPLADAE